MFVIEHFLESVRKKDMDRRIQKSRQAIYQAFITLLNQQSYEKITVQKLIDEANVGRSTFYAHFETKEALLEEVCQDLFEHTFIGYQKEMTLFELLAHLFLHFKRNQDKIATLLLSNNSYFTKRLKNQLEVYLFPMVEKNILLHKAHLPKDFLKNYVTSTFVETVTWWLQHSKKLDEETIAKYYLDLLE